MKASKIICILCGVITILSSCNEDFLERYPLDEISTMDYWKTTSDLELYVNQFYPVAFEVKTSNSLQEVFNEDIPTDDIIFTQAHPILMGTRLVPGAGGWDYTHIRDVNIFLENYQNVEEDFEKYKKYVGEAYFFRAFFYFSLVTEYGDVPLIDKTLNQESEELYDPRTPRNEVIDFIIGDLDLAIEYMPSGIVDGRKRLNREIAQLFKSRVCLYEGSWEKYHAGDAFAVSGADPAKYFNLAASSAEAVINSGVYSVYSTGNPNNDYFFFGDVSQSRNKGVLLWKKYDFELLLGHARQFQIATGEAGGLGLSKNLVESYLCTDGKPIFQANGSPNALYQGDGDLITLTTNRDPRLTQSMFIPGFPIEISGDDTVKFVRPNLDGDVLTKNPTGYQICKTLNQDPVHHAGGATTPIGYTGVIIFRYAEVLLNYAEAKAELGTINQNDIDISVNELRARVGMPDLVITDIQTDPNWQFPELSPLMNEIRRERRVELLLEGFRWNDIARWAAADELVVGKKYIGAKFNAIDYPDREAADFKLTSEGYFDELRDLIPDGFGFVPSRDYLAPISTEELTLNTNLEQNPGWN